MIIIIAITISTAEVLMIFYSVPFPVVRSFISDIAGEGRQGTKKLFISTIRLYTYKSIYLY